MSEDIVKALVQRQPSLLARLVLAIDDRLRVRHSVVEYSRHPLCILRIQLVRLDRDIRLADGTAGRAGERMIELHLWNEHIPTMPAAGATVGWARRMNVAMRTSLSELAHFLAANRDLDDVHFLRARTPFAGYERRAQNARLMHGYGFELLAETTTPMRRLHQAAENVLATLMVLALNRPALRADTLRRDRPPLIMSRQVLERRYLQP